MTQILQARKRATRDGGFVWLNVRVDARLHRDLKVYATEIRKPLQDVAERAVRQFLNRLARRRAHKQARAKAA